MIRLVPLLDLSLASLLVLLRVATHYLLAKYDRSVLENNPRSVDADSVGYRSLPGISPTRYFGTQLWNIRLVPRKVFVCCIPSHCSNRPS